MSLQLSRIDDPRDALAKAKRYELYTFAKANGLNVTEQMPAILIRQKLREAGKTNIRVPKRTLGEIEFKDNAPPVDSESRDVDAEADLARQFQAAPTTEPDIKQMSRAELAKLCKQRGVKFERTAKKEKLMELLGG